MVINCAMQILSSLMIFDCPGQPGGPPPAVFRHDCSLMDSAYGITAAEEGGVVAFQARFERLALLWF